MRRDRPLLALAPRRHEDAAVVLHEEVQMAEPGVDRRGTRGSCVPAVVVEDQRALEAEGVAIGGNAVAVGATAIDRSNIDCERAPA